MESSDEYWYYFRKMKNSLVMIFVDLLIKLELPTMLPVKEEVVINKSLLNSKF